MQTLAINAMDQLTKAYDSMRLQIQKLQWSRKVMYALFIGLLMIEIATPRQIIQAAESFLPVIYARPVVMRHSIVEDPSYVQPPFNKEPYNDVDSQYTTVRELYVPVTAYSSSIYQTDSTPYITARNTMVRDGVVAANFLPFGTRIKFPDYFGNRVFIVEDRMNTRYWKRIDVWMPERSMAIQFGLRNLRVEIVEQS